MRQVGFGRRSAQKADSAHGLAARRPPVAGAETPAAQPALSPVPSPALSPALTPSPSATVARGEVVDQLFEIISPNLLNLFPAPEYKDRARTELVMAIHDRVQETARVHGIDLSEMEARDAVTVLLNELVYAYKALDSADSQRGNGRSQNTVAAAKEKIHPLLMEHIDASAINELPRDAVADQVSDIVTELLLQQRINLNKTEQRELVTLMLNDMFGLGPLEPLLADESVTDIMVNGPNQIYVERKGKLELTDVKFRDEQHLLNVAQRIVAAVGRRVDESSPICDARLADGSRVNVIIPPLAIDGTSISIRKFSKKKITLDMMAAQGNISPKMCQLLKIAGRCRLNIIISGGTGSGKTTMLNAVSRNIDPGERIVTIEDAAELQLQQPHVVRLETRPPNLEGKGEVTMRGLVKNALRMRPDRIILGEVRGGEAIDLLQAMNTGHDGSLGTLHANRPREALTRLENMVNMAGLNLPPKAIREQIASAVNLIIQVSRMRDGIRRVTHITEVVGMEGDVITTQDLYTFQFTGEDETGRLKGEFISSGLRPAFYERAEYYGLGRALMDCL
ncbi:CpaF family protein [Pedomonas sp. V897]|uniref:CpaF family protein n=1 Tax=Pedomonas sp. V897 TaxID=3446482 RepID=UPI003EDEBAF1